VSSKKSQASEYMNAESAVRGISDPWKEQSTKSSQLGNSAQSHREGKTLFHSMSSGQMHGF
jgi:hypothetical protein